MGIENTSTSLLATFPPIITGFIINEHVSFYIFIFEGSGTVMATLSLDIKYSLIIILNERITELMKNYQKQYY